MSMQCCLDRIEQYLPKYISFNDKNKSTKLIKLYEKNSKASKYSKLKKNSPRFYIDHHLCGLRTLNQSIMSVFWRFSKYSILK